MSEQASSPKWVRILINLGGIGVVAHETISNSEPRWGLLVAAIIMMGLASTEAASDLAGRIFPGRNRDRDGTS